VQALVLAGGEGTRLRPLTLTVPKPVMPLAGRPFLTFMLDWLAAHGVGTALLSCGFMADDVEQVLGSRHDGVELRYVREEMPLGTAGPVRLAAGLGLLEERVVVLNGDVLTDLDLTALLREHGRTGAPGTIALVAVEDPSSYGVVPTAGDGRVEAFLEKAPGPAPTDRINAGAYVLEREAVERIPDGRAVSFEREVFPAMVERGELYAHHAEGYWIDIGTPDRYLEATRALLRGKPASALGERDAGLSLVDADARTDGAEVGPFSVVGPGCVLESGSTVRGSVLHEGVRVATGCSVIDSILAEGVVIEAGAEVGAGAVIGARASIGAGQRVAPEARIAPGARW
jgi:mannose-1-phosphate guanylyltransferase